MLILALILASTALASAPKFPPLTGRVVDDAGVLNSYTLGELTLMLADHERATGEQVVVVTLDSLQGYSIEDFGYQLGRHWGIGQKDLNTGALLIVAPKEHKVRIEVGYGLEGQLTDANCRIIIDNYILPSFKRGDFNAGILAGATSIIQVLGGNPLGTEKPATSFGGSNVSRPLGSYKIGAPTGPALAGIVLIFLIPVIGTMLLLSAAISGRNKIQWGSSYGGDSGSGFGGGSSGGGGGGFSGGGGSFGGGGASGSW